MCEEELQKLLRHSQLYNSSTLKMSLVAYLYGGPKPGKKGCKKPASGFTEKNIERMHAFSRI